MSAAEFIASEFIKVTIIPLSDVITVIRVLGFGIALQMFANFYMGGLLGLEHQVSANVLQVIWGIFKNGLVVVLVWFFPSIVVFFWWQAIVTLIYVLLLRYYLLKKLFAEEKSLIFKWEWDTDILKNTWRFAGGMLLISLVAVINTQVDKLAISKLLPLTELGYYTIAVALSQGLIVITNPIATATLPKFTSLFSESRIPDASKLFYNTFNFVSVIVFALGSVLFFFASDIIYIWTGNVDLSLNSSNYTAYLTIGSAFLAIPANSLDISLTRLLVRL